MARDRATRCYRSPEEAAQHLAALQEEFPGRLAVLEPTW